MLDTGLNGALIVLIKRVCSLSRFSQINAKIRKMCARTTCQSLCQRYSHCVARLFLKAKNQLFLNEVTWDEITSFTLNFAYLSPAFSFSFSLPFSSFHVCRYIQPAHEFISFFKISIAFLKTSRSCNFPLKETRVAAQGFVERLISH